MMLDIPFYLNDKEGKQCLQVTMQCALKHFLGKDYDLEELDRLTGRKPGLWTWTSQIATVLDDLGLKIKYYSKTNITPFLEGESFIRSHFGKDAEHILKNTDLPVTLASMKKSVEYGIFEHRLLKFSEIESNISQGHIVMIMIDHNKLAGVQGLYNGHFVILTGFDDENVYYHESGPNDPTPNKRVNKEKFIEAWNANGTDNDVIIIFGKK